jgi:hypothetical protein
VVISLSGRVLGRASGPSRSRVDDDGGSRYVTGKMIGPLGFSHRGEYIGGGVASEGGPGGHTPWLRRPGAGRAALGCARPLAPLRLCFRLCLVLGKIGTSAFVSSNSDNISYVAFLKHKNSIKQGTGTVTSR